MSLDIKDVSHSFGQGLVLSEVNLCVDQGDLAAILGQSGCGKTTLLRIIAGLLEPDTGSITLAGRDLKDVAPQHRRVCLVPQEGALFPHLNVVENVGFGLRGGTKHPRTRELLDLVGLTDLAYRMPHEISGGQAQRVAVARALAVEPDLVLLDEPFSALDASARSGLRTDLRRVLAETGTTAVLVTHDQEEALSLADRLVLMAHGKVIQVGSAEDVYQRPLSLAAARLSGPVLCLPAEASATNAQTMIGAVSLHQSAQGAGTVLVRPEQLELSPPGENASVVTGITFYGHDADINLRHPSGTDLVVRVQQARFHTGDLVGVRVNGPVTFCPQ